MLREKPGVKQQRLILHLQPAPQPPGAHTNQVKQVQRERVIARMVRHGPLIGHGKAILLPRTVKERDQAVVKEIKKITQRLIFVAPSLKQELGVVAGEDTKETGQPHEGYRHLGRS